MRPGFPGLCLWSLLGYMTSSACNRCPLPPPPLSLAPHPLLLAPKGDVRPHKSKGRWAWLCMWALGAGAAQGCGGGDQVSGPHSWQPEQLWMLNFVSPFSNLFFIAFFLIYLYQKKLYWDIIISCTVKLTFGTRMVPWYFIYSQLCHQHHYPILERFHYSRKRPRAHSPTPPALGDPDLLSVSADVPVRDTSYKWDLIYFLAFGPGFFN